MASRGFPVAASAGRRRMGVITAAAVALLVVVVLVSRGTRDADTISTGKGPTTTAAGRAGAGSEGEQQRATAGTGAGGRGQVSAVAPEFEEAELPLAVTATGTRDLRDGDAVSLHVVPRKGSVIYGFEAFLCKGNETYRLDADIRPTFTGKCVTKPLSAGSQDYLDVRVAPPYTVADATFRVGTGTETYRLEDGSSTTVTCGRGDPCTLVLKLQFPNGYGFEAIPLTFR